MSSKTIGKLRERAKIYRKKDLAFGASDVSQSLDLIKEVWCSAEPVSASIFLSGKQTGEDITHRLTMRIMQDLTHNEDLTTEIEIHIDQMRYRPLRATDWEGRGRFIVIDALQLGKVLPC